MVGELLPVLLVILAWVAWGALVIALIKSVRHILRRLPWRES